MTSLDLPAVNDYERHEVARHLEQTYHMNYGGAERQQALYFRLPYGSPEVVSTEAPAVLLRELAAAVRGGKPGFKLPHMAKPDRYRMSELLRQSAARPARENTPGAVQLAQLAREFDTATRIAGTPEIDRAEWLTMAGG